MNTWSKALFFPFAALVLGALLTLAFAPFEIFPFAMLAPAGLLALIINRSPKYAFWLGFLFGFGFFSTGVYWVFISIHVFGDVPNFLAGLITCGFIAILALFPAAVCYFCNRYFATTNTAKLVYAFPAMWVISEWSRSWIFTGFPWLFVGTSQTNSPLRGFAPILSVYGVTLAVCMISGLIVAATLHYRQKHYKSAYFNLLAIATILVSGGLLSLIPWSSPVGKPLSVSLIQGDIPQSLKWSPDNVNLSFDRYSQLTKPLLGKSQLIIWPESSIPMTLQDSSDFINALDERALATHTAVILGIPIKNPDGDGFYNGVVTLGADKSTYLKRRLVPYGEYMPFKYLSTRIFDFMQVPMSNMIAGKPRQPLLHIGDVKILTAICYEITYPELIRTNDSSIGILLTVTNDAWFGDSSAQSQHLQMGQMRAIELARPVLFVSNDGITAIIGPDGKIESTAPAHEAYVLSGTVQPMVGVTPWMFNGIDPMIVILFILLFTAKRQTKREQLALQSSVKLS